MIGLKQSISLLFQIIFLLFMDNSPDSKLHVDVQVGNQRNEQVEDEKAKYDKKQEIEEEQQDDEQPQYKLQKMLPKMSQKQKLIQQNIKLKTQIYQLAKQLDEILLRDKNRKKKYGINADDDDETVRTKKLELKKQQLEIMEMKNKIFVLKRQLESVYNNRAVMNKQDELVHLKNELKALVDEKDGLIKIKNQQSKALKALRNEEQYKQKIQSLKSQLHKVKEQSRLLSDKILESQRILRKNHEQYISKQQKVKQLEHKLATNKQKSKNRKPVQTITSEMISQLQDEIGKLQQQRRQGEKVWQDKIRAIDLQLHQKRIQEEKKLLILKEKQKQLKLNQLRIKELRKLIRHNAASGSVKKNQQQMDMSQFRHRRNIRYLDK